MGLHARVCVHSCVHSCVDLPGLASTLTRAHSHTWVLANAAWQDLVNTAWAFAKVGEIDAELLTKIAQVWQSSCE